MYDSNFLHQFDGGINPSDIDIGCLIDATEKYVSQMKYVYATNLADYETIELKIMNTNIPHLLGLSKNHHYGLDTYHAPKVFEKLKNEWTLKELIRLDERWFLESQGKLLGTMFLYQMLNLVNADTHYTIIFNRFVSNRLKRDQIYFIFVKINSNYTFSLELTNESVGSNIFIPRSLKLNDTSVINNCPKVDLTLISKERIKQK